MAQGHPASHNGNNKSSAANMSTAAARSKEVGAEEDVPKRKKRRIFESDDDSETQDETDRPITKPSRPNPPVKVASIFEKRPAKPAPSKTVALNTQRADAESNSDEAAVSAPEEEEESDLEA